MGFQNGVSIAKNETETVFYVGHDDFYGLRALRTYVLRALSRTAGYRVGDEERQSPLDTVLASRSPGIQSVVPRYNNKEGDTLR